VVWEDGGRKTPSYPIRRPDAGDILSFVKVFGDDWPKIPEKQGN